jgi:hypothetical protein
MGKLTFNLVNDLHLLRSRQYRKMVDRLGRVQDLEGDLFILSSKEIPVKIPPQATKLLELPANSRSTGA